MPNRRGCTVTENGHNERPVFNAWTNVKDRARPNAANPHDDTITARRPWITPRLFELDQIEAAHAKFLSNSVEVFFKPLFPLENTYFNGPWTEIGPLSPGS
jgi:hypothetical protein